MAIKFEGGKVLVAGQLKKIFFSAYLTCSELPSNVSTMIVGGIADRRALATSITEDDNSVKHRNVSQYWVSLNLPQICTASA